VLSDQRLHCMYTTQATVCPRDGVRFQPPCRRRDQLTPASFWPSGEVFSVRWQSVGSDQSTPWNLFSYWAVAVTNSAAVSSFTTQVRSISSPLGVAIHSLVMENGGRSNVSMKLRNS